MRWVTLSHYSSGNGQQCLWDSCGFTKHPTTGISYSLYTDVIVELVWVNTFGREKMADISQTTFSKNFSSLEIIEIWLRFQWSLFLRVQLAIFQHWFRRRLGAGQVTSHCLNQLWLVKGRIYASLGLNDLNEIICYSQDRFVARSFAADKNSK